MWLKTPNTNEPNIDPNNSIAPTRWKLMLFMIIKIIDIIGVTKITSKTYANWKLERVICSSSWVNPWIISKIMCNKIIIHIESLNQFTLPNCRLVMRYAASRSCHGADWEEECIHVIIAIISNDLNHYYAPLASWRYKKIQQWNKMRYRFPNCVVDEYTTFCYTSVQLSGTN